MQFSRTFDCRLRIDRNEYRGSAAVAVWVAKQSARRNLEDRGLLPGRRNRVSLAFGGLMGWGRYPAALAMSWVFAPGSSVRALGSSCGLCVDGGRRKYSGQAAVAPSG